MFNTRHVTATGTPSAASSFTSDPHDIVAELLRVGLGHSDILPAHHHGKPTQMSPIRAADPDSETASCAESGVAQPHLLRCARGDDDGGARGRGRDGQPALL